MHVVANAAVSVDGKLSTRRREQVAISGPDDFARVDRLRASCDAVMVGVGTVLADDPLLTVGDPDRLDERADRGDPPQPARVVADSRLRTPTNAAVLDQAGATYLLASEAAEQDRVEAIEATGASVVVAGEGRVDLPVALAELEASGVGRLLVEGGGELLFSMFEATLVDELSLYVGSFVVGGQDAPTLVDGEGFVEDFPALELESVERVDDGVLLSYRA